MLRPQFFWKHSKETEHTPLLAFFGINNLENASLVTSCYWGVRFRAQGLQPRFISEYNWATLQATLHIGYRSPPKIGWEAVESGHKQRGVSRLFTNFGHFPLTNDSG